MGEETTQLDLTDELDRLQAIRGETDDGDAGELRVDVHDATLDPEVVEGRRLVATTVEGPAALRGRQWEHPLDALHRPHVTARRGDTEVGVTTLVDAPEVGGPDLETAYVLDRETYVVGAVESVGDAVGLRILETPVSGEDGPATGDRVERSRSALETATVSGYADRQRYRTFDRYGRPTTLGE